MGCFASKMHSPILVVPHWRTLAEWTYNVRVDALIRISTILDEDMKPWIAGPGKQTMFHSGLVVYAHCSLKVLSAFDEQHKCLNRNIHTATPLVFGKQQRTFSNHAIFNNH